ncbi:MAG: peptidyl-prolyl cis-trans isomerase, partial [Hyphomicrobiaceae bacterium]|nr:peptidyl-prolyl cis-trans isomerase [Hyphomicrobiaceae bacterium]
EVPEIDRGGKTADGKPALEHPEASKIAEAAFAGAVGIEGEATDLADGGYAWVDVLAIAPQKQKSFEEVKAEVKTGVMEADRRKEITSLASKLVERLGKGESAEALAAESGAKLEKTPAVTRNTSPPGLSQNAVQQAFALPKGGATSAPSAGGKARTILRVVEITPAPAPTPEQSARLKDELARQIQSDVLAQYVSGLETRFGLSVNDEALKQALGGGGGREQPDYE